MNLMLFFFSYSFFAPFTTFISSNNNYSRIIIYYLIFIIVISLTGGLLYLLINSYIIKKKEAIKKTSKKLFQVNEVYNNFGFLPINIDTTIEEVITSKKKVDDIASDNEKANYAIISLFISKPEIAQVIKNGIHNQKQYGLFLKKISLIGNTEPKIAKQEKIPVKIYHREEDRLTNEIIHKAKKLSSDFTFYFYYTSPMGRNTYYVYVNKTMDELQALLDRLDTQERNKISAQIQRSLMSRQLRYDIMKRDNFRCVLCGRSQEDGIKLHVDHIKPVKLGGLTIPSNLRTLCDDCNLGKSDKYDPTGIN